MPDRDDPYYVRFMREALRLAEEAAQAGETPVGAVAVLDGHVLAGGRNRVEERNDPLAHAELLAIRAAREILKTRYLNGVTIFVTLEPCPACAGAIIAHRLAGVVFGAYEPKWGAGGSRCEWLGSSGLPHQVPIVGGVLAEESAALLRAFFPALRSSLSPIQGDDVLLGEVPKRS